MGLVSAGLISVNLAQGARRKGESILESISSFHNVLPRLRTTLGGLVVIADR